MELCVPREAEATFLLWPRVYVVLLWHGLIHSFSLFPLCTEVLIEVANCCSLSNVCWGGNWRNGKIRQITWHTFYEELPNGAKNMAVSKPWSLGKITDRCWRAEATELRQAAYLYPHAPGSRACSWDRRALLSATKSTEHKFCAVFCSVLWKKQQKGSHGSEGISSIF